MWKKLLNSDNYIKELKKYDISLLKAIQIGYDLQSGTYEKYYYSEIQNLISKDRYEILIKNISEILKEKSRCSIIEIGIGEGNMMRSLIENLNKSILDRIDFYGTDLSFPRLVITKKHISKCNLFVGDMNNLPFLDNTFDIVYTSSAIEPNRDKEEVILKELHRISKYFLILFEISYKDADVNLKKRFDEHGYVKYIYETINKLDFNLKSYKELTSNDISTYNSFLYLIEKNNNITENEDTINFVTPIFHDNLIKFNYNDVIYYKSEKINLLFNIINNIPVLMIENSISIN